MQFNFTFSRSKLFLISCLVFIAGTGLASYLPSKLLQFEFWYFSAAMVLAAAAFFFWQFNAGVKYIVLLLTGVFLLAVWRYAVSLPADTPDKIWHYNGRAVTVRGYVADEPDIRQTNQKLEIEAERLNLQNGGLVSFVSGKILVTAELYPEYEYGDELELACELKQPEEYQGFAYDRYLARYRIYSVCYYPKINLAARGRGNWFYAGIFSFKNKLSGLIEAGMSEPEASLARPIIFGGQQGLEPAIRENFQKLGLTHILAVSGFNVSILAAMVIAALLALGLSRHYAFYLAAALLAVYIVLVGLPASAMRAGLMAFLVLWALKLGRLNKIINSLVLAAAVLLAINPELLRDDVGFQLSFLAIAGLVFAYPILEAAWQKIKLPRLKGISDALLITLAAQVFTLPVLAYNFSRISLIAPLANLAVLWAVPVLTAAVLAALPLSWLAPGLSLIWFLPAYLLSKYILTAAEYLAKLPYGQLEVDYVWPGWAVLYYLAVVFVLVKLRRLLLKSDAGGKI